MEDFNRDEALWIMLLIQRSAGEGCNLQRGSFMIILVPQALSSKLCQVMKRIARPEQQLATCHTYLLINEASLIGHRMNRLKGYEEDFSAEVASTTVTGAKTPIWLLSPTPRLTLNTRRRNANIDTHLNVHHNAPMSHRNPE